MSDSLINKIIKTFRVRLHVLLPLLLFFLQLWLVFKGVDIFGKYWNPIFLLLISLAIPMIYLVQFQEHVFKKPEFKIKIAGFVTGIIAVLICALTFHHSLLAFPRPVEYSDVIPQIETLYHRFANGVFPYASVPLTTHEPFPVYMTLHWLPVAISEFLKIESRWSGFILLTCAMGIYGFFSIEKFSIRTFSGIMLPAVVLWVYLLFGGIDIPVSFELNIAAYYIILATGLLSRNYFVIAAGLILCFLSRYTLVFWLPFFSVLMLKEAGLKKTLLTGAALALAVVLLYIIPFLAKDFSILKTGLAYHNQAAVDEWKGYGNPPISYTMEAGLYFAEHFKSIFSGMMEQRVFYVRIIQASIMILLNVFGIFIYYRFKNRINPFQLAFVMLYLILVLFYFFSPLTYRYYLITTLFLSGIMTGEMLFYFWKKSWQASNQIDKIYL